MSDYLELKLLTANPFETIDQEGVGQLVRMGVERGRATRPAIKLGVCGEHGGDPDSIAFFHTVGLDYVSCSPYRLPIARLAAAHSALGAAGPPPPRSHPALVRPQHPAVVAGLLTPTPMVSYPGASMGTW